MRSDFACSLQWNCVCFKMEVFLYSLTPHILVLANMIINLLSPLMNKITAGVKQACWDKARSSVSHSGPGVLGHAQSLLTRAGTSATELDTLQREDSSWALSSSSEVEHHSSCSGERRQGCCSKELSGRKYGEGEALSILKVLISRTPGFSQHPGCSSY